MTIENVFDNGEAEARSAALPAAGGINPVEAFGQPGEMLFGNSHPIIGNRHIDALAR